MTAIHVIVPAGIDDATRPSGGNAYDREVCRQLEEQGWTIVELHVAGNWPTPDARDRSALARSVGQVPTGGVVLIDGLIASSAPEAVSALAMRGVVVVLVHLPLGLATGPGQEAARHREALALGSATAVVTTGGWTRRWLLDAYGLGADRVHVAEPGTTAAALSVASEDGGHLLCVAAVAPHKGQDTLIRALEEITDLAWDCTFVGALDISPTFSRGLLHHVSSSDLADRVAFAGPLTSVDLDRAYAGADLLVHPTRFETYGMVIVEALSRGLPVVTSDVGGTRDALGRNAHGSVPGILVPPDDPRALAEALRSWLTDGRHRGSLRARAVERRAALADWAHTTACITRVLTEVAA